MKTGCVSCGELRTIWRLGYCLDCLGRRCGSAEAEVARLRAEVERLARERDEAHAVLADAAAAFEAGDKERLRLDLCDRYARTRAFTLNAAREAERRVWREDVEINARRAESAEARVAELEGQISETRVWLDVWARENMNCSAKARELEFRHRALLSPRPAPLPDLLAEVLPPKCWHCSYNGTVVVKFCMRDGCPETPKPKPAPCGTCGGSGVTSAPYELDAEDCPDCRGEEKK